MDSFEWAFIPCLYSFNCRLVSLVGKVLACLVGGSGSILVSTKNTIILFVCPPKVLHKHCLYFLLGLTMIPKETGNNVYAKFWVDKQRVLRHFLYWLIPSLTNT